MRIPFTLLIFFLTVGCTSWGAQPPMITSTETLSPTELPPTATLDWPARNATERARTVYNLQTASATLLPTRTPTETLTPTPTRTPVPQLLSSEGPWLLYLHRLPRPAMMDISEVPAEFILLNQDGSGRTSIPMPCSSDADPYLMEGGNPANYMVPYGGGLYLFRPPEPSGLLIRSLYQGYPSCAKNFRGDEKGGLLASFHQATSDVSPELILYELPAGTIRERFYLVRCSKDTDLCERYRSNWPEMMRQQPIWSPNGRYLAFIAILDATSSDLFVYDTQEHKLRRLTSGPDWVGPIEWSPDGTQIIMQEILNDGDFLFDPYSKPPSSVWSVSVSTSESKLLYSTGDAYTIQNILLWLDAKHFVAYHGFLVDADQARDLRLVDLETGATRILFNGVFVMVSFDPVHEVFAIYEQNTEYCLPTSICMVSMKDGTIRPLPAFADYLSFPWWDENTGLFVSSSDCTDDPQSLQAYNYQGTPRCVPKTTPTPTSASVEAKSYRSPDGKWSLSAKEGLWLQAEGQPAVQVSQEAVSNMIWCPDSSCFFFFMPRQDLMWDLYRVSMPDLTSTLVDEGIEYAADAQWLGGEK